MQLQAKLPEGKFFLKAAGLLLGLLAGCTSLNSAPQPLANNHYQNVPEALHKGDWRYLGLNQERYLSEEINDSSIKQVKPEEYTFTDRKTVTNPRIFSMHFGLFAYKYLITKWYLNCKSNRLQSLSVTAYDDSGKQIFYFSYQNGYSQEFYLPNNTFAQLQYNYVCKGYNRWMGY